MRSAILREKYSIYSLEKKKILLSFTTMLSCTPSRPIHAPSTHNLPAKYSPQLLDIEFSEKNDCHAGI